MTIPPALMRHAKLGREVVVAGVRRPPRDLGPHSLARSARPTSKGVSGCCRTPCSTARLITSPSSPRRCASSLAVQPGETVVDATFGAGGHARLLADELRGRGRLIAIDRDPTARPYFERFQRTTPASRRASCAATSRPCSASSRATASRADAVLLDLGVSSMQIDRPERGFSYATDAPLDMRMDPTAEPSGARGRERDGTSVSWRDDLPPLRRGALRPADRACDRARRRERSRSSAPASSSRRSRRAIPAPARFGDGHPAKRVFQALRIAVNDELGALEAALPAALDDAAARRAARRDQLPLARGPHREALPPRPRARLRVPARLPRLRVRPGAGAPRADAAGRAPVARRELDVNPRAASARLRAALKT